MVKPYQARSFPTWVSKYYSWFYELGYPNLDLHVYNDGSWDIIQYLNRPSARREVKWQSVLGPMKNVMITYEFCKKWVQKLDITKRHYMEAEEKKTQAIIDEAHKTDKHVSDMAERATKAVMKNQGLVNRIAKNGLKEMDLLYLAKRVPKSEISKPLNGVRVDVPSASKPPIENVHAKVSGNSSR